MRPDALLAPYASEDIVHAPRDGGSWTSCPFAINGRFLTQPTTGVQRYAREVTRALDAILFEQRREAVMHVPASLPVAPPFRAISVDRRGRFGGHLWEQGVLPGLAEAPLLNLCNTAPAFSRGHVVCLHDANIFLEPESYGRGFRTYYRALQPHVARRALRVSTVSTSAAGQLGQHLGLKASHIAVLPNGHEHALRWNGARSRLFQDARPRRPYVLLLGSRAKHKNIGLIIGLAEALDGLGLDILVAGGESAIFAETERAQARNLRFLGTVSDDDLALLLSQALCLAFPSLTEGFGLPVVEAMVLGCPVVSSDRASLPEVCGGAALLADPTDPGAWLQHITAMRDSTLLQDDLRERGRIQARRFSWAATARGYLDLFGP